MPKQDNLGLAQAEPDWAPIGHCWLGNLGVKKLGGQKFFFFFLLSFFIIRPKMLKMHFFENSEFWLPYFFFYPLTYTHFESPCCTASLYQISWNFVKGVGAGGHKAEKQNCALRAQFWPPRCCHLHGTCGIPGRIYPESLGSATSPALHPLPTQTQGSSPNVSLAQLWLIPLATLAPTYRCGDSRGELWGECFKFDAEFSKVLIDKVRQRVTCCITYS